MCSAPTKVIIDSDMGWDDVLSTLYLMKCPSIEIVGVTVTGCGETNLRWGTIIAQSLMALGNQTQAVVCAGTSTPLQFDHTFPQSFRSDMNDIMGLLGSINPEITIPLDPRPAWQFISETLNTSTEQITILSLGGFTNLATMLIDYPQTDITKIARVFAMAGAVFVDGNVASLNNAMPEWNQGPIYSTNNAAEWNVFVDPLAAKNIFETTIPLTLIPLDACDYVILDPSYGDSIHAVDPIATLAKAIFVYKAGGHSENTPVPIFDPLATMIMAGGMPTYQSQDCFLDVNMTETITDNQCGKTFAVCSGSRKITVVQGVSQVTFAANYARVINAR
jgi:purine nucleosidase